MALVPTGSRLADIVSASSLDYSSRVRAPMKGDSLHCKTQRATLLPLRIAKVLAHEDELQDSITMKYWIRTDGSENFSGLDE